MNRTAEVSRCGSGYEKADRNKQAGNEKSERECLKCESEKI